MDSSTNGHEKGIEKSVFNTGMDVEVEKREEEKKESRPTKYPSNPLNESNW